jgi:hypothetical protein
VTLMESATEMKLWSIHNEKEREPARLADVSAWVRRLALLTFALLGPFAIPMQGYQGPQDEPFTVNIADADGVAMPDVDVVLMRDGKLLARMKTGTAGRASVRVGPGPLSLSIHQNGYIPVDQVVDHRSMSGSVLEIKIERVLQAHETVNVQATTEDITEQTSSPASRSSLRKPMKAHYGPLTLTDALPLVPGIVLAPNGKLRSKGPGRCTAPL